MLEATDLGHIENLSTTLAMKCTWTFHLPLVKAEFYLVCKEAHIDRHNSKRKRHLEKDRICKYCN